MDNFSISQIASYSGIKPHTIRVWEQRYNALNPDRSAGNTRYYNSHQLRRLLNIVSLMKLEYKVSELCSMSDKELFGIVNSMIDEKAGKNDMVEYFLSQLLAAGMSFDEAHFEKIFSNCLTRYGMKETYTKVIYPLLYRIGMMWSADSMAPANEHFISNILKQKLFAGIDALPPPKQDAPKWLLFLKEDEHHDLGLLFASYLVRLASHHVVYLGADVPFASLQLAIRDIKPNYLLFFWVKNDAKEVAETYMTDLKAAFHGRKIFVTGNDGLLSHVHLPEKTKWLRTVKEFQEVLGI